MTCEGSSIRTGQSLHSDTSSLFDQLSGVVEILSSFLSSLARPRWSLHQHSLCYHCMPTSCCSLSPSFSLSLPTLCWSYSPLFFPSPTLLIYCRTWSSAWPPLCSKTSSSFQCLFRLKCRWENLEWTKLCARVLLLSSVVTKCIHCIATYFD